MSTAAMCGQANVVVIRRRVVARVDAARATREMDAPTYYYIDPGTRARAVRVRARGEVV